MDGRRIQAPAAGIGYVAQRVATCAMLPGTGVTIAGSWEAEPSLSFAPDAVAAEGWHILAATMPPLLDGGDDVQK